MLTAALINNNIPRLQLSDTVIKAKQLIADFNLTHLPVISENKFLGLISEEDLLDIEEEKATIEMIQEYFLRVAVADDAHFLNAVSFANQHETNVIPVLNKSGDFVGTITAGDLLKTMGEFAGANEMGGLIVLEMERSQFAISEISRIVESNDCTILHLNTIINPQTGLLTVTLHINKKEISTLVSTFERFEYNILYNFGTLQFEDETESNYKNLMHYLNI